MKLMICRLYERGKHPQPSTIVTLDDSDLQVHAMGQSHGPGNYFSEIPDVSMSYGSGLILFRVLPGKEYQGSILNIPSGAKLTKSYYVHRSFLKSLVGSVYTSFLS